MCGIAGYAGKNGGTEFVLNGLEALEYRGYDSAGIAYMNGHGIESAKELGVGAVTRLRGNLSPSAPEAQIAVGHTRWATHGEPSLNNAHPHFNNDGTIAVVHNGIIENHESLRKELAAEGYSFVSQTDTEVIPHLLDKNRKETESREEAFEKTIEELVGAYAILAYFAEEPKTLHAARLSSPLVIGTKPGEHFIASDAMAIAPHTDQAIYLDDYEVAHISEDSYSIKNIEKAVDTTREAEALKHQYEKASLGEFPHYMLKEIHDTPDTVRSATRGRIKEKENIVRLGGLESVQEQLRNIDRIIITACGTSYYAGLVGESLIEEIAGIPVEVELASEFKYKKEPISKNTALIAISQSGETADTIAAIKKVEDYGILKLGLVNAPGSTISRITDAGVYCHAGPEISVASTKAFISQVTVLSEIAMSLSKGSLLHKPLVKELSHLPEKIEGLLETAKDIELAAKKYAGYENFLFIGRGYNLPTAYEGALKLKEVSYIHAEAYGAGEMKHGPLAMIDENFPTVAIATDNELLTKTISNIEEIRARKGPVLAVATKGNESIKEVANDVIYIPETLEQTQPILAGIALQLFAYHVAVARGHNVDRPRNLAKSVTVE